ERAAVDAAPGHLLADDRVVAEVVGATPAVLLGHLQAEQPVSPGLGPDLAVDDAVLLPLLVERHGLLVEERADRLAEGLVLGLEDAAGHAATVTVRLSGSNGVRRGVPAAREPGRPTARQRAMKTHLVTLLAGAAALVAG